MDIDIKMSILPTPCAPDRLQAFAPNGKGRYLTVSPGSMLAGKTSCWKPLIYNLFA
jgi:hypothetical protein